MLICVRENSVVPSKENLLKVMQLYEDCNVGRNEDKTPDICGYYGRACRRQNKANCNASMVCLRCPISDILEEIYNARGV